jgi:hypothetical protein
MENIPSDSISINDSFANKRIDNINVSSARFASHWFADYANFFVGKVFPPYFYSQQEGAMRRSAICCHHEVAHAVGEFTGVFVAAGGTTSATGAGMAPRTEVQVRGGLLLRHPLPQCRQ